MFLSVTVALPFVFILGLVVGSFLNVVIYRLRHPQAGRFWQGRSRCPHCSHVLGLRELIPLFSFLWQKGKCRSCGKKIDIQYPLVELATALLFSLVFVQRFGWDGMIPLSGKQWVFLFQLSRDWFIVSMAILVFVYDLRYMMILDAVMLPAVITVFVLNLLLGFSLPDMLIAAVVGFGFFALQFFLSKGAWIGGGDMRLGFFMGLVLGWQLLLLALFLAYLIGALSAIILIVFGKKTWGQKIPFGTFLSLALVSALTFGESILAWYMNLLGL